MQQWLNPDHSWRSFWVFWFYQINSTLDVGFQQSPNKSGYLVVVFTKVLKLATYFIEKFSFCDKKILKLEYLWWNLGILGIWSKITAGLVACAFLEV